jgi:hypothetical protein
LAEVLQLYKMELSTNNGGIFGNMMGLGKTRVSLGMILVGFIHLHMHESISLNPNRHLPKDFDAHDTDAACLS